jgi:hypothetical protein
MLIHYTPHAPRPFAAQLTFARGCWIHTARGYLLKPKTSGVHVVMVNAQARRA